MSLWPKHITLLTQTLDWNCSTLVLVITFAWQARIKRVKVRRYFVVMPDEVKTKSKGHFRLLWVSFYRHLQQHPSSCLICPVHYYYPKLVYYIQMSIDCLIWSFVSQKNTLSGPRYRVLVHPFVFTMIMAAIFQLSVNATRIKRASDEKLNFKLALPLPTLHPLSMFHLPLLS